MDFSLPAISWRTAAPLGGLVALLAWETAQPYFPLFRQAGDRARHGVLNLALGLFNAAVISLAFAAAWLAVTHWSAAQRFGLLNVLDLSALQRTALAVFLLDAWTYGWHWLNHRVAFFWRFHRWHHADREMDVTTASRFHTGEIVLSSIFRMPVLALIGCSLGELAVYELLLFAVVQFHHANIAIPERLDRVLRLVIVTPALHKVHHSEVRAESDSNYSSLFSWWDRVFRTLRLVRDPRKIVFGVQE
jgi:sterol desaturase/sphingolipid hydroxylase (fatty acid hydroxylase superfamily)